MILLIAKTATKEHLDNIIANLALLGLAGRTVAAGGSLVVAVAGDTRGMPTHRFSSLPGVEKVVRFDPQCPLVLESSPAPVQIGTQVIIGEGQPVIMAGPCAVESRQQIATIAEAVRISGASMLRGGIWKPRSSPYDFTGLGEPALEHLAAAGEAAGLPVVAEVMSPEQVQVAEPYLDMLQIGARNMYNYELLKAVGRTNRPVLLKRSFSATLTELLQAAEYIMLAGNPRIVLCERGIRTFEGFTRNTLDLSAVPALKSLSGLPVVVDPSHATGRRELIRPMARAAIACGADGLLIEVHTDPASALSDSAQAIIPETLRQIVDDVHRLCWALAGADDSLVAVESIAHGVKEPVASGTLPGLPLAGFALPRTPY